MWLAFLTLLVVQVVSLRLPDNFFSRGDLDYRNLVLDTNSASLYVGARSRIFRLWAYNVNDTSGNLFAEKKITLSESELSECRASGNIDSDCQPSTRFMALQDQRETLYVCSSVAMKPEIRVLESATLKDRKDPRTEIGICAQDPMVNSTAVIVEWGNPKELPAIYSGIRTGMAGENHLIYRPALQDKGRDIHPSMRTIYTDPHWLNEPQFVGSFDIGEYVYFFFREIALESGPERTVRSRVARICKKDTGGKTVLKQVWTSFVKARLNCSISAQFPFYFDEIQAVTRVETSEDTVFYATMSTSNTAFTTAAICFFSLKSINQVFNHGQFMENAGSSWSVLPSDAVPSQYRPGTCIPNSETLSVTDLHFAKSHLLMADNVPGGNPILATRDTIFTHILAESKTEQTLILAIDGRTNEMWKLSHWKEGSEWKWSLLEQRKLSTGGLINAVALLPGEFFFIASTSGVSQFSLSACALYQSCSICAVDPYCSWNTAREMCQPREKVHSQSVGWISSWAGRGPAECAAVSRPVQRKAYPSESVHFLGIQGCQWQRDGTRIQITDRFHLTKTDGLLLLDVSRADNGDYECTVDNKSIVKYRLNVDHEECAVPKTVEAYKQCWLNHCKRRNEYDFAQKSWNLEKNKILQCQINESKTINRID